jgi:magnesium chelatase family protein
MLKEGSHFDLPIALGLLIAMGVVAPEAVAGFTVLGELGLDGVICPEANGGEAAWADGPEVLAPANLLVLINHFKGNQLLTQPAPALAEDGATYPISPTSRARRPPSGPSKSPRRAATTC